MKFEIDSQSLECIKTLNNIVDSKSEHNILRHILIKGEDKFIKIMSTNLEIIMKQEVRTDLDLTGYEIKVKGNLLVNCLKNLQGVLTFELDNNKLHISDSNGKYSIINCQEQYPQEKESELIFITEIYEEVWQKALSSININIHEKEKGAFKINISNNILNLIAYDQKRNASFTDNISHENDFSIIISPDYIDQLLAPKSSLKIWGNEEQVCFEFQDTSIVIKKLNTYNFTPTDYDFSNSIEIDNNDFKQSLISVLPTSSELIGDILIENKDQKLNLYSYTDSIGFSKFFINSTGGLSLREFVNGKDLLDILNVMESYQTFLFVKNQHLILKNEKTIYVLGVLVFKKTIPVFNEPEECTSIELDSFKNIVQQLDSIINKKSPCNIIRYINFKSQNTKNCYSNEISPWETFLKHNHFRSYKGKQLIATCFLNIPAVSIFRGHFQHYLQ